MSKAQIEVLTALGLDPFDTEALKRIEDYHPFLKKLLAYAYEQQECINFLMQLVDSNRPN